MKSNIQTLLAAVACLAAAPLQANAVTSPPPYDASPVFFEVNREGWLTPRNNELLPQGKIVLPPFAVENVEAFDWQRHVRNESGWWVRIERFDYLITLFESDTPEVRAAARKWFDNWLVHHAEIRKTNDAAWKPMVAGIRAMVFTRYLAVEAARPDPDTKLMGDLRKVIKQHQGFLARDLNFPATSNQGLWNVMGLFETTRVYPDDGLTEVALTRLSSLTSGLLSSQAVHMQHSPGYHILYMEWLKQSVTYLTSLKGWTWSGADDLATELHRMETASYYLFDHGGHIPKIADSGGVVSDDVLASAKPGPEPWLFDPQAGYAVFKDDPSSPRRRYVVFNIQGLDHPPEMTHRLHHDMSAVYYSHDGEVILSDQGRYSARHSIVRDFFVSPAAHNSIFPGSQLKSKPMKMDFAQRSWMEEKNGKVRFGIAAHGPRLKRVVVVPEDEDWFRVDDRVLGDEPFAALWNIGPDVEDVVQRPTDEKGTFEWILTSKRGNRFKLAVSITGNVLDEEAVVEVASGRQLPMLGWYSPGFEEKTPSTVLVFHLSPLGALTMTTRVERLP